MKIELTKRQAEQLLYMMNYCNDKLSQYENINIKKYNPVITNNIINKIKKSK